MGPPNLGTGRPSMGPTMNGIQTAVTAKLGTIATWLLLSVIPADWPADVRGSFAFFADLIIVFGVAFVAARLRDAQWWSEGQVTGLKQFFVLPLVLGLVASAQVGCATASPRDAWGTALATYSAAAAGMAVYCDLAEASADACIKAAQATLTAEPIIEATQAAIQGGVASDELLEHSTSRLEALTPVVQEVNP